MAGHALSSRGLGCRASLGKSGLAGQCSGREGLGMPVWVRRGRLSLGQSGWAQSRQSGFVS